MQNYIVLKQSDITILVAAGIDIWIFNNNGTLLFAKEEDIRKHDLRINYAAITIEMYDRNLSPYYHDEIGG